MELNGVRVLKGRVSDLSLKDVLNPKFYELLEEELEDAKVIHLGIALGTEEDQSIISMGHSRQEDVEKGELVIEVSKEEDIDQILNVIKLFNKGG